ncbi:MAG TPA: PEP-CTERM sorting domain-containing protein [Usitatibacter sp.]|jgi:hypothetical protein|nr:PEP-CTERM sorting domain-containing protein [Usitatibacter sp.]
MTKLLAAIVVGTLTVMGPVAQAEKNDMPSAGMATRMASAVPASNANAADLQAFPDVPGLSARDTGLEPAVRKPEPTVAWLLALGFLGLVVLRRTRSGPTM